MGQVVRGSWTTFGPPRLTASDHRPVADGKRPVSGPGLNDRTRALTYHDAHYSWKSVGARGPPKPRAPCVAASACTVPPLRSRMQTGQARGITKARPGLRRIPRLLRQRADCDLRLPMNACHTRPGFIRSGPRSPSCKSGNCPWPWRRVSCSAPPVLHRSRPSRCRCPARRLPRPGLPSPVPSMRR